MSVFASQWNIGFRIKVQYEIQLFLAPFLYHVGHDNRVLKILEKLGKSNLVN